jgi:polygalacturonase
VKSITGLVALSLFPLAAILPAVPAGKPVKAVNGRNLVIYPAPGGVEFSTDYSVEVNGNPVAVYTARVNDPPYNKLDYGGTYSFVSFDFRGRVKVRICGDRQVKAVQIRPLSKRIQSRALDSTTAELTLDRPANLSFEPEGKRHPLLVFANPMEQNRPRQGDPNVVYFGPGLHQPDGNVIRLKSNQTLYLAGGAVVQGAVVVQDAENVAIRGRGILDGSPWPHLKGPAPRLLGLRLSRKVAVEGIILRGSYAWTLVPEGCENVTITNVKICGGRVYNDDGINPVNTRHLSIRDCFIRSDDDCIALKGLRQEWGDVDDIRVEDTTLWCDRARVTLLGHESRAANMQNLLYRNIDIVHWAMTAFLLEPGEEMNLQNVRFEDIRIEGEGQRSLVGIRPTINQYMRTKLPGHIRNIQFKNIRLTGALGDYAIAVDNYDDKYRSEGVALEEVTILGEKLVQGSPRIRTSKGAAVSVKSSPAAVSGRIGPDHPESLQEGVLEAVRAGRRKIAIPAGTYRIGPPEKGSHLQFRDVSNFEIDARGVTLVFLDQRRGGIEFRNCRNVKFHGATIRYEITPFTQGVVEAIAPDGKWYDLRIEKGYPNNFDEPSYFPPRPSGNLFDPKTRWFKRGIFDNSAARVERLGPDKFRLYWNRAAGPNQLPVSVGDLMAFRGSGQHNATVVGSSRVELTDLTITTAGSFALWEGHGDGPNIYRSITVKRGPRPPGAETDPLLSATADAFHSTNMRQGPVIEGCYFESMHDDGIAIHGTYMLVLQADGHQMVINKNSFQPGDPLRLFDPLGAPAGEAVVKDVKPLEGFQNSEKSRRVTRNDNLRGPYWRITLDRPLKAGFDYLAGNPKAIGSGYVLRHNTIRNHRARGMLLKADDGLVEGNTVDGSTMGGIVITPEFWWNEACYSRNVIVRKNTVRNVAYWQRQWAGIIISALDKEPVPPGGHRNITVEDNTLESINGNNLFISSAQGVVVRRNRFVNAQRETVAVSGAQWGADPGSLIFVTQAEDVRFEGNTASGLGPAHKSLIQITPTASVKGQDTGIKVKGR